MLQINILKNTFSGVGFEGLYPRPKLVAMDPNSWGGGGGGGGINPCHKCILKGFFLNFATLELIKGCISNIIQRKTFSRVCVCVCVWGVSTINRRH